MVMHNKGLLAVAALGIAVYMFKTGTENYYSGKKAEVAQKHRIHRLESGLRAIIAENQMIPVSVAVDDVFPISRYNPPRIQGRRT